MRFPFALYRVEGDSMLPTLRAGQIIVGKRNPEVIQPKDIVVFRHRGLLKVKRVKRFEQGAVYLVGDNPAVSTDSRHFGKLPAKVIIATVVWPRQRTIKVSVTKE